MTKEENDIIDDDLYEELDEEKMHELVEEARIESLLRAQQDKEQPKPKRRFPKWPFWLISIALLLNVFALVPQTFSIPALDFLITSAKLSTEPHIKEYKKAVAVIETDNNKGTGFSITENGVIITNYHVIEGYDTVTVAYPENGLFVGKVTDTFPEIDLAIIHTDDGKDLPYLSLADTASFTENEAIYFIGNPLSFQGIANEGTIIDYVHLKKWELPVLMLDAPVYRGNSGSPVINETGEVIGVVFATLHHEAEGRVGLFVPINYFHEVTQSTHNKEKEN